MLSIVQHKSYKTSNWSIHASLIRCFPYLALYRNSNRTNMYEWIWMSVRINYNRAYFHARWQSGLVWAEGKRVKWPKWHTTGLNGDFLWIRCRIFGLHSMKWLIWLLFVTSVWRWQKVHMVHNSPCHQTAVRLLCDEPSLRLAAPMCRFGFQLSRARCNK
jgi:hypothetical protein